MSCIKTHCYREIASVFNVIVYIVLDNNQYFLCLITPNDCEKVGFYFNYLG